jgi:roadblock/LC7 domain-containing protein
MDEYRKHEDESQAFKKVLEKRKISEFIDERSSNMIFLTREDFRTGKEEIYNPRTKKWVPKAMQNDTYLMDQLQAEIVVKSDEKINGLNMFYDFIPYGYRESIEEAEVDIIKVIKDLSNSYSDSNESQGKMVQLLRGLAFSDDPKANEFMKALDKATTQISNKMFGSKKESVIKEVKKWSSDVKIKWTPPEGTFTKSASEIASIVLKGHNGNVGSAIKAINFYINRAGKKIDTKQKGEIEKAMEILQKKQKEKIVLSRDRVIEGIVVKKGSIIREVN